MAGPSVKKGELQQNDLKIGLLGLVPIGIGRKARQQQEE